MYTVALLGNPNSGKTTLFNYLTKMNQTVGNWTGVTVEKKEGRYFRDKEIKIVDLPGVYSLTPYSPEEKIARDFILDEKPDLIINIVDATSLERNLYLSSQLAECNVKAVLALNMLDELEKDGITVDEKAIEELTGIPAVSVSALKGKNIGTLMERAKSVMESPFKKAKYLEFSAETESAVAKVSELFATDRFTSVKILEKDPFLYKYYVTSVEKGQVDDCIAGIVGDGKETVSEIISYERHSVIEKAISALKTQKKSKKAVLTEKIDKILLNKYLAFPIFAVIIWLMYFISIQTLGALGNQGMEWIFDRLSVRLVLGLLRIGTPLWAISLLVDGIFMGVGAVLTFLPQIILLFLCISLLEGCGYMARVAFIMDKLFRKLGLSGKSFIPMIIGCGCSVPAIMAARTVENEDERRMTIMLTPFVPCSAKLPVFALFVGAFFPSNPFIAPSMYLLGIAMVIIGGLLLKKFKIFRTQSDTFLLELPPYRLPTARNIFLNVWEKVKGFLVKAGTIIFTASIIIWVLQTFNWKFEMVDAEQSLLATIGKVIAPIFVPLGFGDWRASVSLLVGIAAKENVVSSLSILLGASGKGLTAALGSIFTPASAYAYMAFILLSSPCVAALGATRKEMGSTKWLFIAIGFQMLTAYVVALFINTAGNLYAINKWIVLAPLIALTAALIGFIIIYNLVIKKKNGRKKNAD